MSSEPTPGNILEHYQKLQRYVGWADADARRIRDAASLAAPAFDALIDDFYRAIESEPGARKTITGGREQIERLKVTLRDWLAELFCGRYDEQYVARRWKVSLRHVEIGLDQAYVNVAMSRLRNGLAEALRRNWKGAASQLADVHRSLHTLIDLDLAIIQSAYQAEHAKRQQEVERLKRMAEQQRAERRESAFGRILDESLNEIYMFDSETLRYLGVNRGGRRNLGYDRDELMQMTPLDVMPTFTQAAFEKMLLPLREGEPSQVQFNTMHRRKDGSLYDVEVHLQLSNLETPPVFVAIALDTTTRNRAQEQALRAQRLAAIGETVAGLAHESRNAFQRSQACLEMLSLELEDRPNELQLVDRVQRALDHLHHLYEEVRDYAAPVNLDRQDCDLQHIWRDAWSQLEMMRGKRRVRLTEDTQGIDLHCPVDWFQLGQVFRNVFENAISAVSEDGEITVRCHEDRIDDAPAIHVVVCDSGPGVPVEARSRMFDPFFTTKTKGTGLGMAIAKRIVEAHGGRIFLGKPSPGAEIVIALPRT